MQCTEHGKICVILGAFTGSFFGTAAVLIMNQKWTPKVTNIHFFHYNSKSKKENLKMEQKICHAYVFAQFEKNWNNDYKKKFASRIFS